MKYFVFISLILATGCNSLQAKENVKSIVRNTASENSLVKHIVIFRYKSNVSNDMKAEIRKRFVGLRDLARLPDGSKYIISIEAGLANSPEGADQGFQDAYIVTFRSIAERNYYVGRPFFQSFDPAHDDFKKFVGPALSTDENGKTNGAFVFDFAENF